MKNLLAGEQQAAVTVAVEALMDNKPEAENFAVLDPKVRAGPADACGSPVSGLRMSGWLSVPGSTSSSHTQLRLVHRSCIVYTYPLVHRSSGRD